MSPRAKHPNVFLFPGNTFAQAGCCLLVCDCQECADGCTALSIITEASQTSPIARATLSAIRMAQGGGNARAAADITCIWPRVARVVPRCLLGTLVRFHRRLITLADPTRLGVAWRVRYLKMLQVKLERMIVKLTKITLLCGGIRGENRRY